MSHYPASAYRMQLARKYSQELTSPYTDQQRVTNIKQAIDKKVFEFTLEQRLSDRHEVQKLKKEMS